jgi:putative membrane protein
MHPLVQLALRWSVLALGVALAAAIIPGIEYRNGTTLFLVVVVLGLFNAFLKPLLVLFTLPFVLLTLGLGVWLINAVLLYGAGWLIEGFTVAGFGSALLGALIVSVTNLLVSHLVGGGPRITVRRGPGGRGGPPGRGGGDVIDV